MCRRCEGCTADKCGATGCSSCPVTALGKLVPIGNLAMSGAAPAAAFACRQPSNSQPLPFLGRASLPDTAVYPASEFGGCGGSQYVAVGDYMVRVPLGRGAGRRHESGGQAATRRSWLGLPCSLQCSLQRNPCVPRCRRPPCPPLCAAQLLGHQQRNEHRL